MEDCKGRVDVHEEQQVFLRSCISVVWLFVLLHFALLFFGICQGFNPGLSEAFASGPPEPHVCRMDEFSKVGKVIKRRGPSKD